MEKLIQMSRVLNEYRQLFLYSNLEISLNEVFILDAIKNRISKAVEISKCISKDRCYVSRELKSLENRGLILKSNGVYILTIKGIHVYEESRGLIKENIRLKKVNER